MLRYTFTSHNMDGNFNASTIIGNLGPLKGPITTLAIIFKPFWVLIVITNNNVIYIYIYGIHFELRPTTSYYP